MDLDIDRYNFSGCVPDSVRIQAMELLDGWKFQSDADSLYIEPLEGGLNNVNLIISDTTNRWVLKIRPPDYEMFGTDQVSSLQAQRCAALLGIAPKVSVAHDSDGHFVSEFIVGETLRPESARKNDLYGEVIKTLHTLHGGQCSCRDFSIFDDIRLFMRSVDEANIDYPSGFSDLLGVAFNLENRLTSTNAPRGFCHNDLVPQNFISCGDGLRLVDFDYAGNGWIAVDLASATSQFEMSEDEVELFLRLYDEALDDGQRARVAALRFCNNLREVSFTLFAEPLLSDKVTTLSDLNFTTHREFNLEQAQRATSDPVFGEKCEAASMVRAGALF